ncbi:MAG: ParA family chromosome partitioning protein [Chlorobi bacterium OLB4]|nr:MAG: ParA family chromosome partitioning protein [Chlorobi bacterium OLB4]
MQNNEPRRYDRNLRETLTKIISISNQKGGVGKTSTAVNLSSAIAYFGKRVLLIDADPQANATSGVGVEVNDEGKSTYELLISNEPVTECIKKTDFENLDLIPSNINLVAAEIELVSVLSRERVLRDKLAGLPSGMYDFVFIDCPPSLGIITLNSLTSANTVLIPVQCEYYALEGLSQLLNTIKNVKNNYNHYLNIEGYLLTMFDSRLKLANQVEGELRKFFGEKVYDVKISRNVKIGEAPSFGKPIINYEPDSTGAKNYLQLAVEFLSKNGVDVSTLKREGSSETEDLF